MKNIVIGIAEGSKYSNYENWLKGDGIEIIKLSYHQNNLDDAAKCNGIMLSGGNDINPRLYNQPEFLSYCDPKDIDEKRDEFEWKIMQHVEQEQKPLLGICRGMHFVNVFFGGTLVPDIPAFGKFNHGKLKDGSDREHVVKIDRYSALYKILGEETGTIGSGHHQSIDMPGFGLVANAISPDGVIEGMERREADKRPFLILIQWHPERMQDTESSFVKNIRETFINAVRSSVS